MPRLPVLVVVHRESAPSLGEALNRHGIVFQLVAPSRAAEAVRAGWAELVLCERLPAWQALVSRVEGAGGAAILWGPPLTDADRRDRVPLRLLSVQRPEDLPEVLAGAEQLLQQRRTERNGAAEVRRAQIAEQVGRALMAIAAQLDLEALAGEVRHRVRDLCDAEGCELWCVDTDTGDLVTAPGRAGVPLRVPAGDGLVGRVAQEARTITLERDATGTGLEVRAAVAVPLIHRGDVLGVLEVMRTDAKSPFGETETKPLDELAPHIAIALYNAQLTQGLKDAQAAMLTVNADLERRVEERTQQIGQAKREWEATFDAIEEPIALQSGFTLRRVNRTYAEKAGMPIREIAGRTCYQVLAGRSAPCPGCPLQQGVSELHAEVTPRDGWYLRFSGFRLPDDPNQSSVVIHYRDVTRQRALETRLRESERLASVGQLASGAAHEINNPLGFVTSNLSSLKSVLSEVLEGLEKLPETREELRTLLEESEEMIGEAMQGTQRVTHIVKALRELSRQEIGRVEISSVNPSIERAVRKEAGDNAGQITLLLESTARAEIIPLQLDRAVGHLLKNALQSTPGRASVTVRSWNDGERIHIDVTDDGEGIPSENLHRIFEPFFTTRAIGQGMGLGLTAAYGIVRRVGGTIEVKSQPGNGSTFSIILPRSEAGTPEVVAFQEPERVAS